MKKMRVAIFLLSITYIFSNSCMENKEHIPHYPWNIFGYLNWHNSTGIHIINMCDEVEKLVNADPTIVNKKESHPMSRLCGMTPLEVAITEAKCKRCEQLLRKKGARDTQYITYWQKKYADK